MPEMGYAGRTVLVFGAAGALGGGLAAAFAEAGAAVAGADKHLPSAGHPLDGRSPAREGICGGCRIAMRNNRGLDRDKDGIACEKL